MESNLPLRETPIGAAPFVAAFKLGLEEVGFVEGQNVVVEYHWLGGHDEGLPALVAELVQRRVDRLHAIPFPPWALTANLSRPVA